MVLGSSTFILLIQSASHRPSHPSAILCGEDVGLEHHAKCFVPVRGPSRLTSLGGFRYTAVSDDCKEVDKSWYEAFDQVSERFVFVLRPWNRCWVVIVWGWICGMPLCIILLHGVTS